MPTLRRTQRQLSFLPRRLTHGGEVRKGKRKLARPIDTRRPMHVTMRASQARGAWSMLHRRHKARLMILVHDTAEKYGVELYRFENVGNHLHMILSTPSREAFQGFLRVVTGAIAFLVTGTRKGRPLKKRFWDLLAWSRIVNWGREFRVLEAYLMKNLLESLGIQRDSYSFKLVPK